MTTLDITLNKIQKDFTRALNPNVGQAAGRPLRLLPRGRTAANVGLNLAPRVGVQRVGVVTQTPARPASRLVTDAASDRVEAVLLGAIGAASLVALGVGFVGSATFVERWNSFAQLVTAFIG